MVGKSKNRRRGAEHLKNFAQFLRLLINVNKNAALQRKGMKIATFLSIAAGQCCLLSNWLTASIWAYPSSTPMPLKNFPQAAQYPLGISQRLSHTLLAVPTAAV
jgi:hypothetical protein